VHHCAISEGKSAASQYDIVFCAKNFANSFTGVNPEKTKVLLLKNIMSVAEMEKALRDAGLVD
jgi:PTS system ascorbate-specific IIB component